jgi:hypothetical protein
MIDAAGIRKKIFGTPGFSTDLCLSVAELQLFRQAIDAQWLSAIAEKYPEHVEQFRQHGLANYHKFADLVDHQMLWSKEHRLLPQQDVEKIKQLPFMVQLRDVFGRFSISDVVYGNTIIEGRQEIYWRIVRPNAASDVGPFHADKWFHNVLGEGYGMFPPGVVTVKIWIPIYCEPGKSGLIVVPDSHNRDWRYEYVEKGGFPKPEIQEDVAPLGVLVPTEPGTLLMFNERMLHGGALNRGDMTRVSAEITMVFEKSPASLQ